MTDTTQKADTWADGRTRADQDVLEKLAELLAGNPEMTRAAAIRALGITNDSDIRRLRNKFAAQAEELIAAAQAALERAAAEEAAQKPKRKARAKVAKPVADAVADAVAAPVHAAVPAEAQAEGETAGAEEPLTPTLAALEQIRDMREKLQADGSVDTAVTQLNGLYDLMIAFSPVTTALRQQAFMLDTVNTMIRTTAAIGFWPQRRKAG